MTHCVYTLVAIDAPRIPRYVGVTRDPARRLQHHRSRALAERGTDAKSAWLRSIDCRCALQVVFRGTGEQCADEETRLIGGIARRRGAADEHQPRRRDCH